jgi:hypothetical protein
MAKQNRKTLKEYFSSGKLPSEEDFHDLIDSMLNLLDEGFDKSADHGLQIAQIGRDGKLMSFYRNIDVLSPIWSIGLRPDSSDLLIGSQAGGVAVTLHRPENAGAETPDGVAGMPSGADERFEFEVAGTVVSHGRRGQKGVLPAPADGAWHDITPPLDGCHAFEVMAGVGKAKSGKYAILHAFALNAFNAKSHIAYHQAHYDSRCNRLELRWNGGPHDYTLQLRSSSAYGAGIDVVYYLTRLWFDPFMQGCQTGTGEKTA